MASPKYSVIVPVYNRPNEVEELLESLSHQTFMNFEVLIIEDGSTIRCEQQVEEYKEQLVVSYYFKENSGQGFTRNYGFERAEGEWLIVFDSDCIIPPNYFQVVDEYLDENDLDAFGGPDKASANFTPIQRAISYSMTSFFTTGGIRGNKKHVGTFHPRSFNMGIKKEVFTKTGGYVLPKKGEDIEFSVRIIEKGFKTGLIAEAFVYHKRRTNFSQFFKQLHFFGTARINVFRFYKKELRLVHFFPSVFTIGLIGALILTLIQPEMGIPVGLLFGFYAVLIFIDSMMQMKNPWISLLAIIAAFIQMIAYGTGLLQEGIRYLLKG